ncbi:hypothetical protein [Chitinophaga sp. CF418]|uniref:hypothetical protein n=1 Tax=Chitinophaga sp. CF418 TaxID=1855287 RepID=UPI00091B7FA8|nr:hypothetical protein [Chitinophaga sp. CF418]SHN45692.1 hypothetical protein SAMN05216311_12119 [Chitinophaga sp. CF418]
MKLARTILFIIVLSAVTAGITASKSLRGFNNLYMTVSTRVTINGISRWITLADMSPYRNFPTSPTQPTVNAGRPLYTSVTLTWVTIGGVPYTYDAALGLPWTSTLVYDDEGQ